MNREYIRIKKPTHTFPSDTNLLKKLDDNFWIEWIIYFLVSFYKTYDKDELNKIIKEEEKKKHRQIENRIAKFIRIKLNNDKSFSTHFKAFGENANDEEIEGYYDITIHNTYWKNKNFHFECKNLTESIDLINKYVCYKTFKKDTEGENIYDGGVLRYFNGKYAQRLPFAGMIGFILSGDTQTIKNKMIVKLKKNLNTSPEGDLIKIKEDFIKDIDFVFNSIHKRFEKDFTIHHFLFDFTI